MLEDLVSFWVNQLRDRGLPDGGFSPHPRGRYRPDATCWAILALAGDPANRDLLTRARSRLAADQLPDGRVCISPDHPEAVWPTSLAVFAWHQSPEHRENQARAAYFLITSSGKHWLRAANSPSAHDSNIKGWPWIADTHSWAEPTALAMMALKIAGYGDHKRVKEATRLLLDRQLPHGGWNYGNTFVFAQELRPMPLSTGIVLKCSPRPNLVGNYPTQPHLFAIQGGKLTHPRLTGVESFGTRRLASPPRTVPNLDRCMPEEPGKVWRL